MSQNFSGSLVAIVTPMHPDGRIDLETFGSLINWHIDSGTDGIVVLGTTGESPTLNADERDRLIQCAVYTADGRVPVIVGTGTNATSTTCTLSTRAAELGADALLIVTPYYNKPTQAGLLAHFAAVDAVSSLPIIAYDVPSRTGISIAPETMAKMMGLQHVIGIKDATGDMAHAKALRETCGEVCLLLTGDDETCNAFMQQGGDGVMTVAGNVAPGMMREMVHCGRLGERASADALHAQLLPLFKALFVESNPIPVKWALAQMGKIQDGMRLPLTPLVDTYFETLADAMRQADIQLENHQ